MKVTNQTFFTDDEDFYSIISNKLPNLNKNIKQISTGWTNIVLDVVADDTSYIVRLPRNDFFSDQIEKDVKAANFIKNNLDIRTSDMKIYYDNERPFSIHKKIEGTSLTSKISTLKKEKIDKVAEEIAKVYYKFHSFDINKLPNDFRVRFYDFISSLPKLDNELYDFSIFNGILDAEKNEKKVFVYGDLNIGNIIINDNDEVEAFIDFSFCGLSDFYTDLSRVSCRTDKYFFEKILESYEKLSKIKLDINKIENRKIMWSYIEEKYMKFMKHVYPQIKF